jgi:hypothetical protein
MTITLIGLIIYFIFLFAFAIFSAFAVYHLFQFGYAGDLCRPVAIGYLVTAGVVILFTLILTLGSVV